jgi:hypothetical protein
MDYASTGENLAWNSYTEDRATGVALQGFLDSFPHRDNLLNPRPPVGSGSRPPAAPLKLQEAEDLIREYGGLTVDRKPLEPHRTRTVRWGSL